MPAKEKKPNRRTTGFDSDKRMQEIMREAQQREDIKRALAGEIPKRFGKFKQLESGLWAPLDYPEKKKAARPPQPEERKAEPKPAEGKPTEARPAERPHRPTPAERRAEPTPARLRPAARPTAAHARPRPAAHAASFDDIQARVAGRGVEVPPGVSSLTEKDTAILFENIRRAVNPDRRDLTVFYGGPGSDLKSPLASTDARRFVFADMCEFSGVRDFILKDLKAAGASDIQVREEADSLHTIKFKYGGRDRELIYHSKTDIFAEGFDLRRLRGLEDGFDVYYETCVSTSSMTTLCDRGRLHVNVAANMRAGGFMLTDYSPLEVFGDIYSLRRVDFSGRGLSGIKFGYSDDGVKLFYKESAEQIPRELVLLERQLHSTYLSRNGSGAGIDMGYLPEYVDDLTELKGTYDRLPEPAKGEARRRLDRFLYYAPPDRSKTYTGIRVPTDEEFTAFVEACSREYARVFGQPEPIVIRVERPPAIVITAEDIERAKERRKRIVITKEDIERARRRREGEAITITKEDIDALRDDGFTVR